jgi:hypothetical protein
MAKMHILWGARWMVLASIAALACGGGNDGSGGDDSGKGGSGDEGGSSGAAGSSTGGGDTGGSGGAATGGKGGTSGKGGSTSTGATGPALDRIEEACSRDCDAQYALECVPPNSNVLICRTQCAAQTAQIGDFCLPEYATVVECRADGGYECLTTYPSPRATCGSEQLAFRDCTTNIGCKRSCKKSVDEGCTTLSLDECIDACIAEGMELPMGCVYTWDSIAMCKVQSGGSTCVDGELTTPTACSNSVMYVAECVSDDSEDMCDGWCWAANTLGCGGDDCATDCAAKLADTTCGMQFTDMLDCALFFNDAACSGDQMLSNGICESEAMAYTTCIAGGGAGM